MILEEAVCVCEWVWCHVSKQSKSGSLGHGKAFLQSQNLQPLIRNVFLALAFSSSETFEADQPDFKPGKTLNRRLFVKRFLYHHVNSSALSDCNFLVTKSFAD